MGCNSCGGSRNTKVTAASYDILGGVSIKSLNAKQISARLALFKRKFCKTCSDRYKCTYTVYLDCKGQRPK